MPRYRSTKDVGRGSPGNAILTIDEFDAQCLLELIPFLRSLQFASLRPLQSTDDYKSLKITPSDETKLSDDASKKLVEISKGVSVSKVQRGTYGRTGGRRKHCRTHSPMRIPSILTNIDRKSFRGTFSLSNRKN